MWPFGGNADEMLKRANEVAAGKTSEPVASAERIYLKCIERGHKKAKSLLGFHYVFGTFGDKSQDGARLLNEAIKGGDHSAYSHLGLAHAKGRFGRVDYSKAFEFYEKAVEYGDGAAAFNIGVMLLKGQGREVDILSARNWFDRAKSLGVANGTKMVEFCDAVIEQVRQDALHARAAGIEFTPCLRDKVQAAYQLTCIKPFLSDERACSAILAAHSDGRVSLADIDLVKEISMHVNNLSFHTGIPRGAIVHAIAARDMSEIETFIARMS